MADRKAVIALIGFFFDNNYTGETRLRRKRVLLFWCCGRKLNELARRYNVRPSTIHQYKENALWRLKKFVLKCLVTAELGPEEARAQGSTYESDPAVVAGTQAIIRWWPGIVDHSIYWNPEHKQVLRRQLLLAAGNMVTSINATKVQKVRARAAHELRMEKETLIYRMKRQLEQLEQELEIEDDLREPEPLPPPSYVRRPGEHGDTWEAFFQAWEKRSWSSSRC